MEDSEKPKLSSDQIGNIYGTKSINLLHQDSPIDPAKVKHELEVQKKRQYHINFLEKLGVSTSLIGWFYLLLIPALVFLFGWSGNRQYIYYYALLVIPICSVFILSGKIITYNGGKIVKFFLAFNGIIGLITLPTLLSGIIGIQSIMGYFYYRHEMLGVEPISENIAAAKPRVITIIMIILLSLAGCYVLTIKNPNNPMFGPISFLSDITNNRYYSNGKDFSLDMRYKTTVKKDFDSISLYKIPNTSYICGTKEIGYVVIDHDYSSLKHDLNVESIINATLDLTTTQLSAKKINSSYGKFQNLKTKYADFTFFDEQSSHDAKTYYASFVKNKHVYEIYTISLEKVDFDKFIKSFKFED